MSCYASIRCVFECFYALAEETLSIPSLPKKKLIEREVSKSGGRQIEGEHTQFKRGRSMQEKQLVCSLSSVALQQITLKLLHINIHVPKVCKQKKGERGRVCESGGRQIEGEHTQFKHGQSMQEK